MTPRELLESFKAKPEMWFVSNESAMSAVYTIALLDGNYSPVRAFTRGRLDRDFALSRDVEWIRELCQIAIDALTKP